MGDDGSVRDEMRVEHEHELDIGDVVAYQVLSSWVLDEESVTWDLVLRKMLNEWSCVGGGVRAQTKEGRQSTGLFSITKIFGISPRKAINSSGRSNSAQCQRSRARRWE